MRTAKAESSNPAFRRLPSVDELLRSATGGEVIAGSGHGHATTLARHVLDRLRQEVGVDRRTTRTKKDLLSAAEERLIHLVRTERSGGVKKVINATGVIIHTNLGRAPLSDSARAMIV